MLTTPDRNLSGPSRRRIVAAAFGLVAASCTGGAQRTTFDLTAPGDLGRIGGSGTQLVINEPTALQVLDSERIMVRDGSTLSYLPDGQWADRLPKLFQVRLIQTFENASRLGRVSRPGDRVVADTALSSDIREFGIDAAASQAVVEVTVRIVSDQTGRVRAACAFSARVPSGAVSGAAAAKSLDTAMSQVLRDIVRWAARI